MSNIQFHLRHNKVETNGKAETPHPSDLMEYQVQFTLPLCNNRGKKFPSGLFSRAENELVNIAGGFSVNNSEGIWKNGIRIYRDINKTYQIACTGKQVAEIEELCRELKKKFDQESIFFLTLKGKVQFL